MAEEIAKLKAQKRKPIIAHDGVSFARSLVAQGLLDQLALMVAPVALGKGLPLFSGLAAPMSLKLTSSKAFPGARWRRSIGRREPWPKVRLPAIYLHMDNLFILSVPPFHQTS
ncbi:dihydrofolate reductase family protein [Mesorhizobium sp.]|uniref:dihydrofolate reductase family protein n=1 Tax=Mesorhizobium sp. TaxID=1871066 RepID=UPI0025CD5747|nr:dihydrofolate reductase family protein [Mesorhizobium sp.]